MSKLAPIAFVVGILICFATLFAKMAATVPEDWRKGDKVEAIATACLVAGALIAISALAFGVVTQL